MAGLLAANSAISVGLLDLIGCHNKKAPQNIVGLSVLITEILQINVDGAVE